MHPGIDWDYTYKKLRVRAAFGDIGEQYQLGGHIDGGHESVGVSRRNGIQVTTGQVTRPDEHTMPNLESASARAVSGKTGLVRMQVNCSAAGAHREGNARTLAMLGEGKRGP